MATREENVKKINDELEMLSDGELEQVAGGSAGETSFDSKYLNQLGYNIKPMGYLQLMFN